MTARGMRDAHALRGSTAVDLELFPASHHHLPVQASGVIALDITNQATMSQTQATARGKNKRQC